MQALETAASIKRENPRAVYRLGFVGYRDYDTDSDLCQLNDNVEVVRARLESVTAKGGDDAAEDVSRSRVRLKYLHCPPGLSAAVFSLCKRPVQVAGGLHKCLGLSWAPHSTKIILHVADAPAHGAMYHDVLISDKYPRGDKHGLKPVELIKEAARRGFDYYFVKITAGMWGGSHIPLQSMGHDTRMPCK